MELKDRLGFNLEVWEPRAENPLHGVERFIVGFGELLLQDKVNPLHGVEREHMIGVSGGH